MEPWTYSSISILCVVILLAVTPLLPATQLIWATLMTFFFPFSDLTLDNEEVLIRAMSLRKLRFKVESHYSVSLARRLHISGWSSSGVIKKINLEQFWQASVIAANELSTSTLNQSWENDCCFTHRSENRQIIRSVYSLVDLRRSAMCRITQTIVLSLILRINKKTIAIQTDALFVAICRLNAETRPQC